MPVAYIDDFRVHRGQYTEAQRFWLRVQIVADSCWLWQGPVNSGGYGVFMPASNRPVGVHRFAYEFCVGPIPAGLQLDHLCRVRLCVNPDHLEPVTGTENVRRSDGPSLTRARMTKAICKNGHPFNSANTYIRRTGNKACRPCSAAAARRYRERQAAR